MNVISVDLGATSGRVRAVFEKDGILSYKEEHRFDNKSYRDQEGRLRWDFSYLFGEVVKGILSALHDSPNSVSIGIDTWGVDYGLLDKEGSLIEDPLCYRDEGSYQKQKDLLSSIPYSDIYKITGIQDRHFNTIYQLYKRKGGYEDVSSFLRIPDLIAYRLTGERRREETNASTTSLYDFDQKRISSELLSLIQVPERIFPKRIHAGEVYGYRKKEYLPCGRDRKIPVVAVATHDTASAVLAASGEKGFAYLSSGTWSLLGTEIERPLKTEETLKANFTNEIGYGSNIRFLKNTRGRFLNNEVRKDYKKKGQPVEVSDIAPLIEKAKDRDVYLDVDNPLFETPGNRLSKIASYLERTKQEIPSSPGERRKVIYTSRALTYRKLFVLLEKLTGKTMDSFLIVGGGNQADILNQYTADALGVRVRTGAMEATVLGNALCQFIKAGAFKDKEEGRRAISRSVKRKTYLPENKEEWERRYASYKKITERTIK